MLHTLLPYILIAMALIGSLGIFLTLKLEMWTTTRRHRAQMAEIAQRLHHAECREPVTVVPVAPHSGLNLNKRVQALRMLRRGESVSHIAAALGVPRSEVELLIRVQGLAQGAAAGRGQG